MDKLPGFRDFFPTPIPQKDQWEFEARAYLFRIWRQTLAAYGFREYDGPPLEQLELFTKKSGEEIVGQLYNFEDKGGRAIALRPEMTPTLARMVAANERQYKKPMKWFSIPQLFRYERKQKGRLREHFQLNADIIGEAAVAADAELIALLIDTLRALGLTADDFVIRLSSRDAWQQFFRERAASGADEYAFFQIIDKLERSSPEEAQSKLEALGISLEDVQSFIAAGAPSSELESILNELRARGLEAYAKIDYGIIRGLAYYTGVVFEAFDLKGEFRAIAGGGRYDRLIHTLSDGKVDLPALGFGMGDVVLVELLRSKNLLPEWPSPIDVYCLIENEAHRPAALGLIQRLRDQNIRVDYSLTPQKANKQFKQAMENKVPFVLSLQASESQSAVLEARLKRLADRSEDVHTFETCIEALKKSLVHHSGGRSDEGATS